MLKYQLHLSKSIIHKNIGMQTAKKVKCFHVSIKREKIKHVIKLVNKYLITSHEILPFKHEIIKIMFASTIIIRNTCIVI